MNQDEPPPSPVAGAETGRHAVSPAGPRRALRPGSCSRCQAEAPEGTRFCPSCQCYLPAPDVGRLASSKRRLAAVVLDGTFQDGGLLGSLIVPTVMPTGAGVAVVATMSALYWLFSMFLWSRGTTPAKRLLRMTVITEDGEPAGFLRMAFRETIGKAISTMVLGLGLLSIPYDPEKQGWHDRMARTWVVLEDEP